MIVHIGYIQKPERQHRYKDQIHGEFPNKSGNIRHDENKDKVH